MRRKGFSTFQGARVNHDNNQILILNHPILDKVSRSAGALVTWINVDEENEWNNIPSNSEPRPESEKEAPNPQDQWFWEHTLYEALRCLLETRVLVQGLLRVEI